MARASRIARSRNCSSGSRASPRRTEKTGLEMLDHVTIGVTDTGRSLAFYDRALRPLGIARLYGDGEGFAGYGIAPKAFFWIGIRDTPQTGSHIAFAAQDRA